MPNQNISTKKAFIQGFHYHMVPEAGLEPARYRYRRILSPLRLPVSPLGHCSVIIYQRKIKCNTFFYFFNTFFRAKGCKIKLELS